MIESFMADLRKAFFKEIIDARNAVESERKSPIIQNIPPPEKLYLYLEYVGMFLMGIGAINGKDYDIARGMIESYEDRLDSR